MFDPLTQIQERHGIDDAIKFLMEKSTEETLQRHRSFNEWFKKVMSRLKWL